MRHHRGPPDSGPRAGFDNKGATYFALANQTANESITALRTVNSFNMQDRVVRLYARMLRAPNRRSAHNAFGAGAALGVGQAAIFLFDALGFWYGGEQVLEDRVTPVEMLKVVSVLLFAAMGASQAQIGFPDVAHGKAATARLFRGARTRRSLHSALTLASHCSRCMR